MALGDRAEVLIDIGGGKPPRSEEVEVRGAGGKLSVIVRPDGGVTVEEWTRAGAVVQSLIVPGPRLVAVITTPKRR